MSRTTSKTLTRLCIGGVAAATIGGVLPIALGSASAATRAGQPSSITITPTGARAVSGNCTTFNIKVTDATGAAVTGATVLAEVTEPSTVAGQDITPCNISSSSTGAATSTGTAATPANGAAFSSSNPVELPAAEVTTGTGPTLAGTGTYQVSFAAAQPGALSVAPFIDLDNNGRLSGNDVSGTAASVSVDRVNLTYPTAAAATNNNNTVSNLTAVLGTDQTSGVTIGATSGAGSSTTYELTARNANGAPVNNVAVRYYLLSGSGSSSTTGAGIGSATTTTACSSTTNNLGQVTCTVAAPGAGTGTTATVSGSQVVRFFVDQSLTAAADNQFETGEPFADVTRTVSSAPAAATAVTVAPNGTTFPAGQAIAYTATVVDAQGNPVQGTNVYASKTGSGGAISPTSGVTNASGQFRFTVAAGAFNDLGAQSVTVTLTQGSATAGTGANSTTCNAANPAAGCAATATNTLSNVAASPSPSASPTTTPTATPTATTSPAPTGTPTSSPTAVTVAVNTPTITAGSRGSVTVSGTAGANVELLAYTRPSTDYRVVRTSTISADGTVTFDNLVPSGNTRLEARVVGGTVSPSVVINVRTKLSLAATRTGVRTYRFSGTTLPKLGQLVFIYRGSVLATTAKAQADGTFSVTRTFTGSGTFSFTSRTSTTLNNAGGVSAARIVSIR